MHDVEAALAQIRGAWMAGRSAIESCPAEWRAVAEGANAECALVALVGHASDVLFRPAPAYPLEPRPLLPALPRPIVPGGTRGRLRRILARRGQPSLARPIIDLVAARGFAMHPADWMPSPNDDWAPDLYAPWLDWVRAEGSVPAAGSLTLETYDQWSPTARRIALSALRRSDPAAARAIIAAKMPTESADQRIKLIEVLATNLSGDDAAFLENLAKDRSERVRTLAAAYLARLGRAAEGDDLAVELAAMVAIGRVGLRRRRQLAIKPLRAGPRRIRRRELFTLVGFAALARALGVTEPQMLETAPAGEPEGIAAFVEMVAATGSDDARRRLLDLLLDDAEMPLSHAEPLGARLSLDERRALLPRLMQRDTDGFATTVALMGSSLGEAPLAALRAAPGYAEVLRWIKAHAQGDEAHAADLHETLDRIALLIDAAAAKDLVARLVAAGVSSADPRLDILHVNAALVPETTP